MPAKLTAPSIFPNVTSVGRRLVRSARLPPLASILERIWARARKYDELFAAAGANIIAPYEPSWSKAVYHLYVVQVENREAVQTSLGERNIGSGIHYPIPLHLQKAYTSLGYRLGDFPVCERAAERILSLPMFPTLEEKDQEQVVLAAVQSAKLSLAQRIEVST